MQSQKFTKATAKSKADFQKAMQREMRQMRQGISDVAVKVAMLSEADCRHIHFRRLVVETQKALLQLEQLEQQGDIQDAHLLLQKVGLQLAGLRELAGIHDVNSDTALSVDKKLYIRPHELE
ncbi:MAG: hypothetical protein PHC51_02020 [bacterium]|nr:hypothetical protein [bacterium]